MAKGKTASGKAIRDAKYYSLFDGNILGGMSGLLPSIEVTQTQNWWDYIEVKPSILGGVAIDLKGLFLTLLNKK